MLSVAGGGVETSLGRRPLTTRRAPRDSSAPLGMTTPIVPVIPARVLSGVGAGFKPAPTGGVGVSPTPVIPTPPPPSFPPPFRHSRENGNPESPPTAPAPPPCHVERSPRFSAQHPLGRRPLTTTRAPRDSSAPLDMTSKDCGRDLRHVAPTGSAEGRSPYAGGSGGVPHNITGGWVGTTTLAGAGPPPPQGRGSPPILIDTRAMRW